MHHASYSILWVNVFTRDVLNDDYDVMIVIIIKMMIMIMLDDDDDYNDYDNGVDDKDDKFHNDVDFMYKDNYDDKDGVDENNTCDDDDLIIVMMAIVMI